MNITQVPSRYFYNDKLLQNQPDEENLNSAGDFSVRYIFQEEIASGDFSTITTVRNQRDNALYVFKSPLREKDIQVIAREGRILQELNQVDSDQNTHVINLIALLYEDKKPILIFPYYPLSSLETLLEDGKQDEGLLAKRTLHILNQLLKALSYLKEKKVVHRDIKFPNVLRVNENDDIVLIDFETALIGDELDQIHSKEGTPFSMSPEGLILEQNSYAGDVWSVACLIARLYAGRDLFSEEGPFKGPLMNLYLAHQLKLGLYPQFLMSKFSPEDAEAFEELVAFSESSSLETCLRHSFCKKQEKGDDFELKEILEKLLRHMFLYDPEERGTPENLMKYLTGEVPFPELPNRDEKDVLSGYRSY